VQELEKLRLYATLIEAGIWGLRLADAEKIGGKFVYELVATGRAAMIGGKVILIGDWQEDPLWKGLEELWKEYFGVEKTWNLIRKVSDKKAIRRSRMTGLDISGKV